MVLTVGVNVYNLAVMANRLCGNVMLENSQEADVSIVDMSYEVACMHFEEDKYTNTRWL